MKFQVYGPYPIPREFSGRIDDATRFWNRVQKTDGLENAIGCYVFGIKTSGRSHAIPYYVGKTERSFKKEIFADHKIRIYNRVLDQWERGRPVLFLLPHLTQTENFSRPGRRPAIRALEKILIEQTIFINPDCENKHGTKMLRTIQVLGFRNTARLSHRGPSKKLRDAYGLQ